MEYKLVLEEHMFVLCAETKHCQVACGFDSDSCTYKTTEPNALKHWLCVPVTYLNSQWSILLHPVLAVCNFHCNSSKVRKLQADVECTLAAESFTDQLFVMNSVGKSSIWTNSVGPNRSIVPWISVNVCYLHGNCVLKLEASAVNAECGAAVVQSAMNFCVICG